MQAVRCSTADSILRTCPPVFQWEEFLFFQCYRDGLQTRYTSTLRLVKGTKKPSSSISTAKKLQTTAIKKKSDNRDIIVQITDLCTDRYGIRIDNEMFNHKFIKQFSRQM